MATTQPGVDAQVKRHFRPLISHLRAIDGVLWCVVVRHRGALRSPSIPFGPARPAEIIFVIEGRRQVERGFSYRGVGPFTCRPRKTLGVFFPLTMRYNT